MRQSLCDVPWGSRMHFSGLTRQAGQPMLDSICQFLGGGVTSPFSTERLGHVLHSPHGESGFPFSTGSCSPTLIKVGDVAPTGSLHCLLFVDVWENFHWKSVDRLGPNVWDANVGKLCSDFPWTNRHYFYEDCGRRRCEIWSGGIWSRPEHPKSHPEDLNLIRSCKLFG